MTTKLTTNCDKLPKTLSDKIIDEKPFVFMGKSGITGKIYVEDVREKINEFLSELKERLYPEATLIINETSNRIFGEKLAGSKLTEDLK